MTVYAKNHQSLHKIYKFGSVSKLLAMTVRVYTVMFFGTGNPNLRSILKPEVELMMLPRRGSNKIMKNGEKCS